MAGDLRFSDQFGLDSVEDEEWFDPFLAIDTQLFVDPFLIFANERGLFEGAHSEIVVFFTHIFEKIAQSGGVKASAHWKKAVDCLAFPEVEELCLGFTAEGTGGAGSGRDIAIQIAGAIWIAIQQGLKSLAHFEEVQIFQKGIGPDRISDATARILLHRFATYTAGIAERYRVPTTKVHYGRSRYDVERALWLGDEFQLPLNPNNRKPILLVPKRFLRPLPSLNADDYWRFCQDHEATAVAAMFGTEIIGRMPKEEIVRLALANPGTRQRYIAQLEQDGSEPYDFEFDPRGFIKWYEQTRLWAKQNAPKIGFNDVASFHGFVEKSLRTFQNYVENQGGWGLLWNENETPKREDASQRLLLGIVSQICAANDVDISREVNIGRGPVDFKISSGFQKRALIELKLAKNTKFWDGLTAQLPTYLKAEEVAVGWFVVIVYTDHDLPRVEKIRDRLKALNEKLPYTVKAMVIDARYAPASASRLTGDLFD
ncbi:MAG: hypothetical protein ACJ8FO_01945 [Sphingomicrobium sp.]